MTTPGPATTIEDKKAYCAAAAHEMNALYCRALGDFSQPPWHEAPTWARDSALKGVDGVLAGNGPDESHASWLEEKRATGWKYGPVKDPEKKEHPCYVPYDELPPAQKLKDHVFVSTVRAMAKALGLLVEKDAEDDAIVFKRRVERLEADGSWADVALKDIRKGDRFRMFEPDGSPVDGGVVSTALGDPYPTVRTWGVQVDK